MTIGKKVGSLQNLKASLSGKGGNSSRITNIPTEGLLVHFTSEVDEWIGYWRYYDPTSKRYVPMEESERAPEGCRSQYRYVAQALDVNNDTMIALDIPSSLAETLSVITERYGTIMGRDFLIVRSGTGLDTSYQALPEDKIKRPLHAYEPIDLPDLLVKVRMAALGAAAVTPDEPAPARRAEKPVITTDDDDDDDASFWKPADDARAAKEADTSADDVLDGDDDDDEWTDEDLLALKLPELKTLAVKDFGVAVEDVQACGRDKAAIIKLIRDAQED